jgi:hypothetical protein
MIKVIATIEGYPDSGKEAMIDTPVNRKTFFIHGTASNPSRWTENPSTVAVLSAIAFDFDLPAMEKLKKYIRKNDSKHKEDYNLATDKFLHPWTGADPPMIDCGFSWEDCAGIENTQLDRAIASDCLVRYILDDWENKRYNIPPLPDMVESSSTYVYKIW